MFSASILSNTPSGGKTCFESSMLIPRITLSSLKLIFQHLQIWSLSWDHSRFIPKSLSHALAKERFIVILSLTSLFSFLISSPLILLLSLYNFFLLFSHLLPPHSPSLSLSLLSSLFSSPPPSFSFSLAITSFFSFLISSPLILLLSVSHVRKRVFLLFSSLTSHLLSLLKKNSLATWEKFVCHHIVAPPLFLFSHSSLLPLTLLILFPFLSLSHHISHVGNSLAWQGNFFHFSLSCQKNSLRLHDNCFAVLLSPLLHTSSPSLSSFLLHHCTFPLLILLFSLPLLIFIYPLHTIKSLTLRRERECFNFQVWPLTERELVGHNRYGFQGNIWGERKHING